MKEGVDYNVSSITPHFLENYQKNNQINVNYFSIFNELKQSGHDLIGQQTAGIGQKAHIYKLYK